jgi:hypothetical protein
MATTSAASPRRFPGRLFLLLGLALTVLGIAGYAVLITTHQLKSFLVVPISGTLGLLLLAIAVWERRSVWRIVALVLVLIVAGLEWLTLGMLRLPAYSGPVAVGKPLPAFQTQRADGTTFTQNDLKGDPDNVLVFFRGRW